MDPQKYLKRININVKPEPTFAFLCLLQKNHLLHIPFENLDIHFGKKIELGFSIFYEKMVIQNRGGFCYELNGLFFQLLCELGFSVKMISANVYNEEKKKYGIDFDHLALLVEIDGEEYLADVGFGEFTFFPLKLELEKTQQDPRGFFLIKKISEEVFQVNQIKNGIHIPQYIFKKTPFELSDFEAACHFQQTSPESHFTQKRIITRPTENGRITLAGNILKIKEGNSTQDISLESEKDFEEKLWEYYSIKKEQLL